MESDNVQREWNSLQNTKLERPTEEPEGSSVKAGATGNGVWKILKDEDVLMSLIYSKNYCHNNV